MQHLILRPGPQRVIRAFRPEPDDTGNRLKEVDVTGRAHEHLFELVTVHAETTLADIFRLMEASTLLQKFYRRDFAEDLCAGARKGAAEPPARERAAHEGIEFLELYQEWGLDTSTNDYSGMQRLHLHGIGHELAEDLPEERRKKGERIEWSVSLTPARTAFVAGQGEGRGSDHRGRRHGQGPHERDPARQMRRRDAGPGHPRLGVGTVSTGRHRTAPALTRPAAGAIWKVRPTAGSSSYSCGHARVMRTAPAGV